MGMVVGNVQSLQLMTPSDRVFFCVFCIDNNNELTISYYTTSLTPSATIHPTTIVNEIAHLPNDDFITQMFTISFPSNTTPTAPTTLEIICAAFWKKMRKKQIECITSFYCPGQFIYRPLVFSPPQEGPSQLMISTSFIHESMLREFQKEMKKLEPKERRNEGEMTMINETRKRQTEKEMTMIVINKKLTPRTDIEKDKKREIGREKKIVVEQVESSEDDIMKERLDTSMKMLLKEPSLNVKMAKEADPATQGESLPLLRLPSPMTPPMAKLLRHLGRFALGIHPYETSRHPVASLSSPPPPPTTREIVKQPSPPSKGELKRLSRHIWRHQKKENRRSTASLLHLHSNFTVLETQAVAAEFKRALTDLRKPQFHIIHVAISKELQFDRLRLSPGANRIKFLPNAGGSSQESEVFSYECLHTIFGSDLRLLATEMEVIYWPPSMAKKTDFEISLYGRYLGVSVTRAFPWFGRYSLESAQHLMAKKLSGVALSTPAIVGPEPVERQILHIWVPDNNSALTLKRSWRNLKAQERSNTIVLVSVCAAPWLYLSPSKLHPIDLFSQSPNARVAGWAATNSADGINNCKSKKKIKKTQPLASIRTNTQ